jgi:acyl dehydratase
MPIHSSAVGRKIPGVSIEVTTRMLLAYAAGIGESSPCFFDDACPEGLVATPSFCAALEWAVINERIESTNALDITAEESMRIVRAGQDSNFYRPIRSGDKLHTSGEITQIKQTRAGALIVQKVETPDALNIEPPSRSELVSTEIFIPRKTPHVYAECSGIWTPINTQRKSALAAGLPDVILHGMATWSIAGREVLKTQGQNNPSRMKRFTADFRAMIVPGGTVRLLQGRCCSRPEAVYYCVENQRGEVAVSGYAFLEMI